MDKLSLIGRLTSDEWAEYFRRLSGTTQIAFSVCDEDGRESFITEENPFCRFIESGRSGGISCKGTCEKTIHDSFYLTDPEIFKCGLGLSCFIVPVEHAGEKALIVGRGGFADYEDLIGFLRACREKGLQNMPVKAPLDFPGEEHTAAIARYISLSVTRQLINLEQKDKIEEKLLRVTSLFDSQSFMTLSRNTELVYRYILDTIEFVFGRISASFMLLDNEGTAYRSVYSIGRHREGASDFFIDAGTSVIDKMIKTGRFVSAESLSEIMDGTSLGEIRSSYFYPVFIDKKLKGIIGIFDKEFSSEEAKIMNAFRDYVQLNLENMDLRIRKPARSDSDERLGAILDISESLVNTLDMKKLLEIALEKSTDILGAEQGSIMLVDHNTSELVIEAMKGGNGAVQEKMRLKTGEGISGTVLTSGEAMLVENIEEDPRIKQENKPRFRTKSFISVPIRIYDEVKGVINISDKAHGGAFDSKDLAMIQPLVNSVALAIQRNLLYEQTEEFKRLSITDPLTGIYNRRYLNTRLTEEITRYNRYKQPFSFLMFDLDGFKEYNDTYGHLSGDQLLKSLASVVEHSLRNIDIAARFGGDEFVVIFPQTPKVDAIQITNRLKEKIDKDLEKLDESSLSVSLGLATFPDDATSIMELVDKTDQALYLAKKGGGNRVVYL